VEHITIARETVSSTVNFSFTTTTTRGGGANFPLRSLPLLEREGRGSPRSVAKRLKARLYLLPALTCPSSSSFKRNEQIQLPIIPVSAL